MKAHPRRSFEIFSLSFLDCICCGFGAILLLLVLTKGGAPRALERASEDLSGLIARHEQELVLLRGEAATLDRTLAGRIEQLSRERVAVARLQGDLSALAGQFAATRELSEVQEILEGRLLSARQTLSEEQKRLAAQAEPTPRPRSAPDSPVAGVPVDSEYVVFVIDTSGSMFHYAWPLMLHKMKQVLDAYPRVKGMQVMNDEGAYMFSSYARRWIPDTPARRKIILDKLRTWTPFSNSSPVEGIEEAIRAFAAPGRRISVYVLGDEFTGDSIDEVVKRVRRMNRPNAKGERPVRIHAIGFPTVFTAPGASDSTGVRFATLMRVLCAENDGAFVALHSATR